MAWVNPNLERLIAGLPGVVEARKDAAEEIARSAEWKLAQHKDTGDARIVVEHEQLNSFVILEDPASLSIEFGRGEFTRPDGTKVGAMEGLHVLRDSIRG